MNAPDVVTLKGMRFHSRVGVLPHETELPQPVEVDVSVAVDAALRAPDVVDYVALYAAVAQVLNTRHISYLEDAAERVATAALRLNGVVSATVSVRKPHVPLPGPVEFAEITITRRRDG
ncbi:MAG: dihydroneopterin aldolase [Gemmatimonadota bacterium]|nr:dihydroneopterin aldolase [Gemmatimonadota bacterium]